MVILITVIGIILLVALISYFRIHTFLAFLIISIGIGIALGMKPDAIIKGIQNGMGNTLGSIVGIIALGAMLGKVIAISGAAQQISMKMIEWVGVKHIRWAFMITGFIVGLPLFYSVGFMLIVPLAITVAHRYNQSAVYVGLPLLASLAVTQGYLPPHPAPLYLVKQLNADMGLTLFYGIIISIPAILVSGAWFGMTAKNYMTPPNLSFIAPQLPPEKLPSTPLSILSVLMPIILIGLGTIVPNFLHDGHFLKNFFLFIGDAHISLLIAVLFASLTLGVFKGKSQVDITQHFNDAIKDVASLFLIFGGAGALKQILTDGGVSQTIADYMQHSDMNPYVLGWGIAAIIRVCVGSSTVAGITTAGFVAPMMASVAVNPNLMVLGIGAGSMMFSHVNDTGFWLFREYFQLSMKDTMKTWSVSDTLVSVMGLIGVLVLAWFVK
jgi:Gnt-I system high-affinity gluconate transporter